MAAHVETHEADRPANAPTHWPALESPHGSTEQTAQQATHKQAHQTRVESLSVRETYGSAHPAAHAAADETTHEAAVKATHASTD